MKKQMQLLCTLFLVAAAVFNSAALAVPDVIRLHVIANSDSPEDQAVKEQVRDMVVRDLGPLFTGMDPGEVEKWILCNQDFIAALAAEVLFEAGIDYSVQVKYGVVDYPTRLYGDTAYPAGKYKSVRIILGEGKGRNWWCVLFPPLCFVDGTVQPAQNEKPSDVKVRFWLWDKIVDFFRSWEEKGCE